MKEFRFVSGDYATPWIPLEGWTLKDMEQFQDFKNYQIEWR